MPLPIPAVDRRAAAEPAASPQTFLRIVRAARRRGLRSLVLSKNRGAATICARPGSPDRPARQGGTVVRLSLATRDVTRNLGRRGARRARGDARPRRVTFVCACGAARRARRHAAARQQEGAARCAACRPRPNQRLTRPTQRRVAMSWLPARPPRQRRLPLDLPFLRELGVTDERHGSFRRWRASGGRSTSSSRSSTTRSTTCPPPRARRPDGAPIRVVDFGCGKGYLTFAVHDHLRRRFGGAAQVTGVELRPELVAFCNEVAERTRCPGSALRRRRSAQLRAGRGGHHDRAARLRHRDRPRDRSSACAPARRCSICSPCCHKELRPQMARPRLLSAAAAPRHPPRPGGRDGDRQPARAAARDLRLRGAGVRVRRARAHQQEQDDPGQRRKAAARRSRRARAPRSSDLKSFYGIREQCLETLLRNAAASVPGATRPP